MRQPKNWLIWRINKKFRVLLALVLLCLTVRSLPYLAPVRAKDIAQDTQAIEFSDRNGLALGTLLTRDQEHTAVVPLNQVSPQFINAILAAEDKRFYHHGALDLKAVARSLKDAIHSKRITSGASTITMQLARMLDPVPRTLPGKIQEIWLSWRLAAGMNKDEILAAYINRLPMGGNIYGLEAASRNYFDIPASDLNLAQASLLAAVPNNPTYFNPYDHWKRLKKRQIYVLNRMVQDNYITRNQAERAYKEEISLAPRQQGIIAAPHFLFWAASQLPQHNSSQIRTTIDRPLQQFVEAQVQQVIRALTPNNVHHAAALVINNHTGEVLAYVGSPDYFNEESLGRNDGVQALRQPGSTLKPFLYELALENRTISPNTILADVPTHYAIPGAKLYSPTDYDETFLGPVRVRLALANSLNVPAVRVLEKVGVQNFLNRLHQLGFEHLTQSPEYYGLGLILGSGEVSLWELARAYVTLARLGEATPLVTTFYQTGDLQKGGFQNRKSEWELITDILSDRYARATAFGVESVLALPFPAAVKTGTSSDFRDTWTVGFTTDYTVATWVGNFNGEPMRQVSGVTGAAPLWNRIMLHLHSHQEPAAFPLPKNLVQRPICAISGLKPTPDCPSVVQEYLFTEDISNYERQSHTVNLASEYDEWLARQDQPSFTSSSLKILSPHNGDFFLLHPGEETNRRGAEDAEGGGTQRLEFRLAAMPTQPVEWWLNGEKLTTQSSNSLFWQLRPGKWTLQAKSGEMMDTVSFQVQLAEYRQTRRGFSIANPPVLSP
ncbi:MULTISPECIES: penicillin-binding protein 1C [Cyanophyceae]|uniref:penicillin-binding protein 1C n=1 Tax=Cyanophyceae TaxID=3028117 RepID=UPI0016828C59|nr:penicillin-binding protein 1C [Trichocoleus sp. FACHB-69]MBD1934518.1 penicillin-binding protein 1C [Trichocoleus sp. FACHB-69]